LLSELAHDPGVKTVDDSIARQLDQFDSAFLPWFEAHCGTGGDIEPKSTGLVAVELQCCVDLVKMKVRTDLDRSVARIGDPQCDRFSFRIQLDLAGACDDFTWDHDFLWLNDRMMNRNEFCAVRECGFDLNLVDHFGNTFHDLIGFK
jgi:hypothetical protein